LTQQGFFSKNPLHTIPGVASRESKVLARYLQIKGTKWIFFAIYDWPANIERGGGAASQVLARHFQAQYFQIMMCLNTGQGNVSLIQLGINGSLFNAWTFKFNRPIKSIMLPQADHMQGIMMHWM
jgi:hypothetical protein